MQSRHLTPAQQRHVLELSNSMKAAQRALTDYIGYLRDEHDVDDSWTLEDVRHGFVRMQSQEGNDEN